MNTSETVKDHTYILNTKMAAVDVMTQMDLEILDDGTELPFQADVQISNSYHNHEICYLPYDAS